MRRIGGDRRQDRENVRQEKLLEPGALTGGHFVALQHVDAGAGEFRLDRLPDGLLVGHETSGELVDRSKLLHRRQAVLRQRRDAGANLAVHAGGANHVEFIEIGGGNREKSQALEQWMLLVAGFFQNAMIELQPGQLAIVEAVRSLRHGLDIRFDVRSALCRCHVW